MKILDDLKDEGWQITIATVAVTDDEKKWQWIAEVDKEPYDTQVKIHFGPSDKLLDVVNEILALTKRIKWTGDSGDNGMDRGDVG